ncbi:MAG: tyrosine-type recombinase/integrase [Cyclobacteriaceae bacterium]|jgi:integrase/recombinase XerD
MATLSLVIKGGFRNPKTNSKGEALLFWRYVHQERSLLVSTKVKIPVNHINWVTGSNDRKNIDRFLPIKKSFPGHTTKNQIVKKLGETLAKAIDEGVLSGEPPSVENLSAQIKNSSLSKSRCDFFGFMLECAEKLFNENKIRRADKYKVVVGKLREYTQTKTLPMRKLTVEFFEDYRTFCRKTYENSDNTIFSDFRVAKAAIRKAVKKGLMQTDQNPFTKIEIPKVKVKRPLLSIAQIQSLARYRLTLPAGPARNALNCFLFAFYNAGMRIGDVLLLKWASTADNRLVYQMQKTSETNDQVSLVLTQESLAILQEYRPLSAMPDNFVFPYLAHLNSSLKGVNSANLTRLPADQLKNVLREISSKNAAINAQLKSTSVAMELGVHITTHTARHSYSNISREIGLADTDISELLNHATVATTREAYLQNRNIKKYDALHQQVLASVAQA